MTGSKSRYARSASDCAGIEAARRAEHTDIEHRAMSGGKVEWHQVKGQESAKRALEIAVTGYHTIHLYGDVGQAEVLRAAFKDIGGAPERFMPRAEAEIHVEIFPLDDGDILIPSLCEPAAAVMERITQARAVPAPRATNPVLQTEDGIAMDYSAMAFRTLLLQNRWFAGNATVIAMIERVAVTIAAMSVVATEADRRRQYKPPAIVSRIHMAEASYYRCHAEALL